MQDQITKREYLNPYAQDSALCPRCGAQEMRYNQGARLWTCSACAWDSTQRIPLKAKTLFTRADFIQKYTDYLQAKYKKPERAFHESLASDYLAALPDSAPMTLQSALIKLLAAKRKESARDLLAACPEAAREYVTSAVNPDSGFEWAENEKPFASIVRRIRAPNPSFRFWRFESEERRHTPKKWIGFDESAVADGVRAFNAKDYPAPSYSARSEINTGWYADAYQDNLYYAAVVLFRHGDKMRAHIGYLDNDSCAYIVEAEPTVFSAKDFACFEDFLRECYKQSPVEYEAERARDSDIQANAEYHAEELREENKRILAEARELIQALKQSREHAPPICEALKKTLRDMRRDMRKNRKAAAKALADPWTLFN